MLFSLMKTACIIFLQKKHYFRISTYLYHSRSYNKHLLIILQSNILRHNYVPNYNLLYLRPFVTRVKRPQIFGYILRAFSIRECLRLFLFKDKFFLLVYDVENGTLIIERYFASDRPQFHWLYICFMNKLSSVVV